MPDGPGSPVSGKRSIVPGAEAWFIDIGCAAARSATIVCKRGHAFCGKVFVETGVTVIFATGEMMEPDVPASTIIGVVSGK